MVTIATWNVNSVKARLGHVLDWLDDFKPDIALLQETKVTDDNFPRLEIEERGYQVAVHGQRTYNGVAILTRGEIGDVHRGLPDFDDEAARFIEASVTLEGVDGPLRVVSVYVPNGQSVTSDKFPYKLAFLHKLIDHAATLIEGGDTVVIGGDYNIAPEEGDLYDPEGWRGDVLFHPEERKHFRTMLHLGLTDAFRAKHDEIGRYSWWDYRGGAWQKDLGVRIDHLLLSPQAADRLEEADIDRGPRKREKASDHTPVWCRLADRAIKGAPYGPNDEAPDQTPEQTPE